MSEEKFTMEEYADWWDNECTVREDKWKDVLSKALHSLKDDPETMNDSQATLLSYRQMLTEENAFISSKLNKERSRLKKMKKDRYILYATGHNPDGSKITGKEATRIALIANMRTSKPEKDLIISGDFADLERVDDILSTHLDFLRNAIKNIDHALYSIKNRIDLMGLLIR
jgi:hypothetical protein